MNSESQTNVAIACQGGGSHTAFTAGVLKRIVAAQGSEFEITALTGTSGGAMCAVLTWYGLRTGDEETVADALDGFWKDLKATAPFERILNKSFVWTNRLLNNGFPLWQVSPEFNPGARQAQEWLRRTLERHLDGPPLDELIVDADTEETLPSPTILVSAVDVHDGGFDIFTDRPGMRSDSSGGSAVAQEESVVDTTGITRRMKPISVDAVLASAAVPPLFDAVDLPRPDGTTHSYWDGLLSQNPPVRNLFTTPATPEQKPDEIWVVRINPTVTDEPVRRLEAINDRRNELAGSLSLQQELHFIDQVNTWLRADAFTERVAAKYKEVTVRQLELDESRLDPPRHLVTSTKLDRDETFIADLIDLGDTQAEEFLANRDSDEYVIVE